MHLVDNGFIPRKKHNKTVEVEFAQENTQYSLGEGHVFCFIDDHRGIEHIAAVVDSIGRNDSGRQVAKIRILETPHGNLLHEMLEAKIPLVYKFLSTYDDKTMTRTINQVQVLMDYE